MDNKYGEVMWVPLATKQSQIGQTHGGQKVWDFISVRISTTIALLEVGDAANIFREGGWLELSDIFLANSKVSKKRIFLQILQIALAKNNNNKNP